MSKTYYKSGSWNAICDYCGKKYKIEDLKLTWDGYLACIHGCWEPRHPQDFVRGKVDRQRVPAQLARPDDVQSFTETTIAANASKLDTTIQLNSVDGIAQYTTISIELDTVVQDASGITEDNVTNAAYLEHATFVESVSDPNITINEGLPADASAGRSVYILHDDRFLGTNEVTVEDL